MAFPTIVGSPVATSGTTATTTPVVNLPPGAAGNGFIMLIRVAIGGTISFTGWTSLANASTDAADDQQAIFYRQVDGTEGPTVTGSSGNAKFAAIVWEISGITSFSTQPPQLSTIATGSGLAPNPTTVTPSGGAKDYLFGVLVGLEGEQTFSTYPANYTVGQQNTNSGTAGAVTTNVRIAGAWRALNAASEDPGAITHTGTADDWTAFAIAIHPLPTLALMAASDTTTLAPTDSAMIFVTQASRTDSVSLVLSDSAIASVVLPPAVRTRLTPMGIPGQRRVVVDVMHTPIGVSDSPALSLTEIATAAVHILVIDTAALNSAEVSSVIVIVAVSDSLSLNLGDQQNSVLSSTVTDTLSLSVVDVGFVGEPLASTDTLALSLTDSAVMNVLTERPVTRLSVMGIPGRRRDMAVSPVNVSDSLGVQCVESIVIQVVVAVADSLALSSTETVDSALTSAVLDTSTLSITDAVSSDLFSVVTTMGFLLLIEQVTVALSSQVQDSLALSSTDTAAVNVSVAVVDSLAIDLPDAGALAVVGFIAVLVTDTLSFGVTETVSPFLQSDRLETLSLFVADISSSMLSSALAETAGLQLSETAILASTSTLSENAALSVIETAAVFITTVVTDTTAVSLTESGILGFLAIDTASFTLLETGTVVVTGLVIVNVSDNAGLGLAESIATSRLLSALEAIALELTEEIDLFVSGEITLSVSDTPTLILTDSVLLTVHAGPTDSLALAFAETPTLASQSARVDNTTISLLETTILSSSSAVADSTSLAMTDTGILLVTISANDGLALSIIDEAAVDATGTIPIEAEDDLTLTLTDSASVLAAMVTTDTITWALFIDIVASLTSTLLRTDALLLQASEVPTLLGEPNPVDSTTLSVTESVASALSSDLIDSLNLSLTESASLFPVIPGEDTLALAGDDTVLTLRVNVAASDPIALSLTDISSLLTITDPPVLKTATDSLGLSLTDNGTLECRLSTSDAASLGLTETTAIAMGVEAHFTASPTSGVGPLTVQFTSTSVGPITTWDWLFGDGDSSTDQHPIHTYLTAGPFTVTLLVSGPTGLDGLTQPNVIVVTVPVPPIGPSIPVSPIGAEVELLMYTDEEIAATMYVKESIEITMVTG